ncbi:MAG: sucrose-6-phosphate hydrolase, partial [Streptococcaceae bacterium]|nr:sucrose-6-phosphate hydrolase [Streptococcaceae bacterium]
MKKSKNWTSEERYRPYSAYSDDYLSSLTELVKKSPWRTHYHIEPRTGLLNDPNAFSYFDGKWQLFYQHFPYGPVHALKSWKHLTSTDLVTFIADDLQLLPDSDFDNKGAYSGSAKEFDDGNLHIFYTGNHRNSDGTRIPYQLEATLDATGKLSKSDKAAILPAFDKVTEHFRDPQIFEFEG